MNTYADMVEATHLQVAIDRLWRRGLLYLELEARTSGLQERALGLFNLSIDPSSTPESVLAFLQDWIRRQEETDPERTPINLLRLERVLSLIIRKDVAWVETALGLVALMDGGGPSYWRLLSMMGLPNKVQG